jgi:hypothetical protein
MAVANKTATGSPDARMPFSLHLRGKHWIFGSAPFEKFVTKATGRSPGEKIRAKLKVLGAWIFL